MKSTILKDTINSFVSIAKGLWVTLKNWSIFRPSVTELYPEEKPNLPENYRGVPTLPVDPKTGITPCIACGMCARACPEDIITVVVDKSDPKNRKPAEFTIDISRCMWCGLCMEACPKKCLKPGRDFELACYSKDDMVFNLDDLMKMGGQLPPEPEEEKSETAEAAAKPAAEEE